MYVVLEIGSGSFKLHKNNAFSLRFQSSLGKNLKDKKLDHDSQQIALASLEKKIIPFLQKENISINEVIVTATAAVREAMQDPQKSGQLFIDKILQFGFSDVRVLTEEEECQYAALAVMEEFGHQDSFQMLDTGGASHQLVEFANSKIHLQKSIPIGSHSNFDILPNFYELGFSRNLDLGVIGTSGLILKSIPELDLGALIEDLEPRSIEQRKQYLMNKIDDQEAHSLLVDFRLAIIVNAFKIIRNVQINLKTKSFFFPLNQAVNYISQYGL